MKKNYVGISCTGHDNSIAIVDSKGSVVFAEAAERYAKNKHAVNIPGDDQLRMIHLLTQYCEEGADIVVAKTWSNSTEETAAREMERIFRNMPGLDRERDISWIMRMLIHSAVFDKAIVPNIHMAGLSTERICFTQDRQCEFTGYDHHLTHAMSASYASGFDEATCCIIDGAGEGRSADFFTWEKGTLTGLERPKNTINKYSSMASLGFYFGMTICDLCGFQIMCGEEWKIMGLAPYGKLDEELLAILEAHLRVENLELVMDEKASSAFTELLKRRKTDDQDYIEIADLAFTAQHHFESLLFQILNHLYTVAPSENLIFSGGCALNSSANGKILDATPFKRVFVPCAPGDDGNAIGSALLAFAESGKSIPPVSGTTSPYLGSEIESSEISGLFDNCSVKHKYLLSDADLFESIARDLSDGMIVGWVQGRAEFGPRALGNRSILASPKIQGIRDKINAVVKYREAFRPLAPSILHEDGDAYFENYQFSPYMERSLRIRAERRSEIPAVCHVDGTGRLQSVTEESNPRFYGLIRAFKARSGTPVLLNTSFNVMGKPIIHDAADAITVFMSTAMDTLVIGNYVFSKKPLL